MRRSILLTSILSVLLVSCAPQPPEVDSLLSGVWRNDTEKLDYHFGKRTGVTGYLEVIGERGSVHELECSYSTDAESIENRTIGVWFLCPQPDWPGYAEMHEFIYDGEYKSFVDTMYIQGIPSRRFDGHFKKITP
jgi:hypothetical protein